MSFASRRASIPAAIALFAATACAATPKGAPETPVVEMVKPAEAPPPPVAAPREEPLPPTDEALARGRALTEGWNGGTHYADAATQAKWIADQHLDEATVRRLLEAVTKPCLAQRSREDAACAAITGATETAKVTEALLEILARVADPAPMGSASIRLLVRLEARGLWHAGSVITQILERRMMASLGACVPPSAAEVAAARRSLSDLAIVMPPPAPAKGLVARWPTADELDEVAYFYAVIADSGAEVGAAMEDRTAASLPKDHPDIAARALLQEEMRGALLDGEIDHHLRAADAYLRTLGYPDPMRLAEEGDMRWGGAGVSFVMRDAARSAEIAGRYDVAEALYRRAQPGGGACGTSTPSRRDGQIEGLIRAAEQRRGCRAAAAERLFAVTHDLHHAYGPERLEKAGFDVARAYAGALHTLGRDDAALEGALRGLSTRTGEALSRLAQRGPEAWALRVRAVHGYADTAQRAGIDRLLGLAEHGADTTRHEALEALGLLIEDRGYDPCLKTAFGIGWGYGSSRLERSVHNVMKSCDTRVDAKAMDGAVRRVAALSGDPDPELREVVATTLGRLGTPRARPTLAKLARDPYNPGGQVCRSRGNAPQVCEPNRPVALAARDALEAIQRADEMRAKQRAARRTSSP